MAREARRSLSLSAPTAIRPIWTAMWSNLLNSGSASIAPRKLWGEP